jgi:carbonic anhydrase
LHGWVYHIGTGTVTAYDEASESFLPLSRVDGEPPVA